MELKFSGVRALILGGSCDMGLALAEAMMVSGLYPLLTYRNGKSRACIHDRLGPQGMPYGSLRLSLEERSGIDELDVYLSQGVDYFVDMAQGDLEGLVAALDDQAVHEFFNADIAGRASVLQKVARAMLARRKGRLVYVSSTAAGRPNPGQGVYAAAKLAAEALYRSLGLELAGRGITTVTLRPGYVNAGRGRRYLEQNQRQALAGVPLGRPLTVQEVVDTIMFLLSDSANGFNATVLTMDGGLSAAK